MPALEHQHITDRLRPSPECYLLEHSILIKKGH